MNAIHKFEQDSIRKLSENKVFPVFRSGDTLRVNLKIKEGANERVQSYMGVCIARSNKGLGSSFTVRKISSTTGVERQFPLYSPSILSIELVKRGIVNRAKLYYMRALKGKSARIEERRDFEVLPSQTANVI